MSTLSNLTFRGLVAVFLLLCISPIQAQNEIGTERTLNVWSAADAGEIRTIPVPDQPIWEALLNGDGSLIAAMHNGGAARVYQVETGDILHERTFSTSSEPMGARLLPGLTPEQAFIQQLDRYWLWDFTTNTIIIEGEAGPYAFPTPNPEGTRFISATDGELLVHEASDGSISVRVPLPRPIDVEWSPDGTRIAAVHLKGFSVIDSESGDIVFDLVDDRFGDAYGRASWSPDGATLLAVASPSLNYEATEILIINGDTLTERTSIRFEVGVFSVDWRADSSAFLAVSYQEAGVHLYNAQSGDLISTYDSANDISYLTAGLSYDERLIAGLGTGWADEYTVWSTEIGRPVQTSVIEDALVYLRWSPDREQVAFQVWPYSYIDLIDLTTPNATHTTIMHTNNLLGMAWSADGTRLLTWTGENRG